MKLKRITSNYLTQFSKIKEEDFQGSAYIRELRELGCDIVDYGKIVGSSCYDLYIVFSRNGRDGRIHFNDITGKWGISYCGDTWSGVGSNSLYFN